MLHLLPIQWLLRGLITLISLAVFGAAYVGWIGKGEASEDIGLLVRWSPTLAVVLFPLLAAAWRWLPSAQTFVFPYLGGSWAGEVRFGKDDKIDSRSITLEVKHTLFGLKMLMDSDESTSKTLVVHAERNPDFEIFTLYYIYLNERKQGVVGGGTQYMGLANIRVEWGKTPKLKGDYFTDTQRSGTLHLERISPNPFWKLWR